MEDQDSRFGNDAAAVEEWKFFLAAHPRYRDTSENWDSMFDFLKEHALYFTRASLDFAYRELLDGLELTRFTAPEQPAPVPAHHHRSRLRPTREYRRHGATETHRTYESEAIVRYMAQYLDCAGNSFSCAVTKLPTGWMLATANGPREITYYIHGNDCAGGFATFHDFRLEDVPRNLRGCDFGELNKTMYQVLPWPQKPAEPSPIMHTEKDPKLHVETGGDSFIRLQEAGARATAEYETNRQQARREALTELNQPPDPRKVEATMRLNAEVLHARKPRGKGVFIVGGNGEQ